MRQMASLLGRWMSIAFLLILIGLAFLPFLFMFVTAVQRTTSVSLAFHMDRFTLDNFVRLFDTHGFGPALLTSSIVVVLAIALNVSLCSLAAFGFEKRPFPGSQLLYSAYLATLMVPSQVTLIPLFLMMKNVGLLNSYLSLALPIVNAFGVFLIRQFMRSIPDELIEAARIDGASDFRIFLSIVLPICRPVLAALAVFTFLAVWNDFLWPIVTVTDDRYRTVTLAAATLRSNLITEYGGVMAGATVAFLVPLAAYIVFQRHFVQGVATSGLKG